MGFIGMICFTACEKSDSEIEETYEEEFEPEFDFHLYGSGYNYNTETRMFSYTVFVHNKGNIDITLDETNSRLDRNEIFQVGVATYNGFARYSVTFQKNQFLFGQGKLGHAIAPGDVLKIEVIGVVNGTDKYPPNRVRLNNLHIHSSRYKQFYEDVNYTF
jgi:hypothetical protein